MDKKTFFFHCDSNSCLKKEVYWQNISKSELRMTILLSKIAQFLNLSSCNSQNNERKIMWLDVVLKCPNIRQILCSQFFSDSCSGRKKKNEPSNFER